MWPDLSLLPSIVIILILTSHATDNIQIGLAEKSMKNSSYQMFLTMIIIIMQLEG